MISLIEADVINNIRQMRGNRRQQFSLSRRTNAQAKQRTESNLDERSKERVKQTQKFYSKHKVKPGKSKLWTGGFKGTIKK